MKISRKHAIRKLAIEREQRDDPEQAGEPAYSTFPIAAARMPSFSDNDLKTLDLGWRYRTAKLFSEAATSSRKDPPHPNRDEEDE